MHVSGWHVLRLPMQSQPVCFWKATLPTLLTLRSSELLWKFYSEYIWCNQGIWCHCQEWSYAASMHRMDSRHPDGNTGQRWLGADAPQTGVWVSIIWMGLCPLWEFRSASLFRYLVIQYTCIFLLFLCFACFHHSIRIITEGWFVPNQQCPLPSCYSLSSL